MHRTLKLVVVCFAILATMVGLSVPSLLVGPSHSSPNVDVVASRYQLRQRTPNFFSRSTISYQQGQKAPKK